MRVSELQDSAFEVVGFRLQGFRVRIWSFQVLGFRLQGFRVRIWSFQVLGFRLQGFRVRIWSLQLRMCGAFVGSRSCGLGCRVLGSRPAQCRLGLSQRLLRRGRYAAGCSGVGSSGKTCMLGPALPLSNAKRSLHKAPEPHFRPDILLAAMSVFDFLGLQEGCFSKCTIFLLSPLEPLVVSSQRRAVAQRKSQARTPECLLPWTSCQAKGSPKPCSGDPKPETPNPKPNLKPKKPRTLSSTLLAGISGDPKPETPNPKPNLKPKKPRTLTCS